MSKASKRMQGQCKILILVLGFPAQNSLTSAAPKYWQSPCYWFCAAAV